jgi:hypothetical protein
MREDSAFRGDGSGNVAPPYDPPIVVPLGNLRDLVALGGTANCDGIDIEPDAGTSEMGC